VHWEEVVKAHWCALEQFEVLMETHSGRLEQQARRARALLAETLAELRARMTPGRAIDEVAEYAYEVSAADFFRNLAREVREHPLPVTLIGIGVTWLIIASGRSSGARNTESKVVAREFSAPAPLNPERAPARIGLKS
jgi:hypothetical protein